MVILHLITRVNQGGTAVWLGNLIEGLAHLGHRSLLVAGNVGLDETEDDLFQQSRGIRVPELQRNISLLQDIKALFKIREVIRSTNPDLVNTHTSKAGLLGRLAVFSLMTGRPKVVHTYHGHILYGYFGRFASWGVVIIERILAKVTDRFIVSGKSVLSDLQDCKIISRNNYTVVRPGVAEKERIAKELARNTLGLEAVGPVVGWMGRFEAIKRPELVAELAQRNPSLVFVAAGQGSRLQTIRDLRLPNLVLPGWVDSSLIWSASDIAISTSSNEAQPIVLIEAGMMALPCVAFDVGSVSDVVETNVNGYLVETFDNLEARLLELADSDEVRRQFGNRARSMAVSRFSTVQFVDAHIGAYQYTLDL